MVWFVVIVHNLPVRSMLSGWIFSFHLRDSGCLIARWIALDVLFHVCITAQDESQSPRRYDRPVIVRAPFHSPGAEHAVEMGIWPPCLAPGEFDSALDSP
jgi:hypothetical protein